MSSQTFTLSPPSSLLCEEKLGSTKKRKLHVVPPNLMNHMDGRRKARVLFHEIVGESLDATLSRAITLFGAYTAARGLNLEMQSIKSYSALYTVVAACFHIACKFEEVRILSIPSLCALPCFASLVSPDALRLVEKDVLMALDWRVARPTPYSSMYMMLEELLPSQTDADFKARLTETAMGTLQAVNVEGLDLDAGVDATSEPDGVAAACILYALRQESTVVPRLESSVMVLANKAAPAALQLLGALHDALDVESEDEDTAHAINAVHNKRMRLSEDLAGLEDARLAPCTPFGSLENEGSIFLNI